MPRKTKKPNQEQEGELALQLFQNAQLMSRSMLASRLGFQFNGQRDLYSTFGYVRSPGYNDYRNLYDRQGIASRLVEKFANDCWNRPPVLIDGSARSDQPDTATPFLKEWMDLADRLRVYKILRQADIMLGFSRYAIIFMGAPGESFDTEAGNDALFYLNAFDEQQATINDYITDTKDPKFGTPLTYTVNFIMDEGVVMPGGGVVHHSRVIHVAEDSLGSRVFGRPRLQTVINRLFDLEKVTGGGAEAAWLAVYKGVLISAREGAELPARDSQEGKYMDEQITAFFNKMQRYAVLTDADVHDLGVEEVRIKDLYDTIISDLAGSKGIPQRILLGSERGELASGQDTVEWNTVIDSRRTNFAEPDMLRPFINWCIAHKVIPAPQSGKFSVEWKPVYPMTQTEEADYLLKVAQAANTATGGVPEEFADVNELRNVIHWPPRMPAEMDTARERSAPAQTPDSSNFDGQDNQDGAAADGKMLTEELLKEAAKGKGFSQNILVNALNKLGRAVFPNS